MCVYALKMSAGTKIRYSISGMFLLTVLERLIMADGGLCVYTGAKCPR